MRLEERADADGNAPPAGFALFRVGAEWRACGCGSADEMRAIVALLDQLAGRPDGQRVAPEPDTRALAERLADMTDRDDRPVMWNMGYKLRRELREALGSEITGLQRLVALEIADDANDITRMSRATLDDLVRWTGAKDGKVVRTILKRLAEAGWEFRVPIDKGKDGRTLYAIPGRALTFRVPEWPEGVTPVTPSAEQGVTGVASEATGVATEATPVASETTGVTPLSSSPQNPSSLSGPARILRAAAVVAELEERELLDWIAKAYKPRGIGWWRTVARNGDLAAIADQWRRAPTGPDPDAPHTITAPPPPECVECRVAIKGPLAADGLCIECRTEVDA